MDAAGNTARNKATDIDAARGTAHVSTSASKPWRGRILYFIGLILLALSLRHAVTDISPILSRVQDDVPLGQVGATLLGRSPTIAFGIAGFASPPLIRRFGPARMAVVAMALGAAGTLLRVVGDSPLNFLICGGIALFGMGIGTVVGPPLVKRYFSDRQATAMTLLTLLTQAGATIPAMTAVPVTNALGWRVSIGSWGILMVLAALPWISAVVKSRGENPANAAEPGAPAESFGPKRLLTNPISIGAAIFYGMAALNTYALLAWLPSIYQAQGLSETQAATMYSIFTFLTLPMALVTPIVTARVKKPFWVGAFFAAVLIIGYLGILLAPGAAVVWAVFLGLSGGAFPFAMVMFTLRATTPAGTSAVTGFGVGVGYAFGTVGPFFGGLLSGISGGWTLPLIVFIFAALVLVVGAKLLTGPKPFEDR